MAYSSPHKQTNDQFLIEAMFVRNLGTYYVRMHGQYIFTREKKMCMRERERENLLET